MQLCEYMECCARRAEACLAASMLGTSYDSAHRTICIIKVRSGLRTNTALLGVVGWGISCLRFVVSTLTHHRTRGTT